MSELKQAITADMKSAMKQKDAAKLATIRLILAAMKQREVDERIELTDQDILQLLDKMCKQRRESITQYTEAGRNELAEQEQFEIDIIQQYMPAQLDEAEVKALISEAITSTGAASMRDMGKVMAELKPKLQGRADMSQVSKQLKEQLA